MALGRIGRFNVLRIIGDNRQMRSIGSILTISILGLGRPELRNVIRDSGQQPALPLEEDKVHGIRRLDYVDGVDIAAVLLIDALEDAFSAGPLDLYLDARIF